MFVALASGVWLSQRVDPSGAPALWVIAMLCAVSAFGAAMLPRRWGWAALFAGGVALGYLAGASRTHSYPSDSVAHAIGDARTLVRVEGVLLEDARVEPQQRGEFARFVRDAPATRVPLRVTRVEREGAFERASGTLWMRVDGVTHSLRAGLEVRVTGHALPVERPQNPGERDFRPLARQRNLAGRLLVPTPGLIEPARVSAGERPAWRAFLRARADLRRAASSWTDRLEVDAKSRALLGAALLGEREGAYRDVQDRFARVGLAHLLAISGLHLGLFAWFTLAFVRALRVGRRVEPLLVALGVIVYLLIVPANAPIVRAAIMTLAFLAAESTGRRYDRLNLLAWTACAIVLARPVDLLSPGFQLSFLAVAALIVLAGSLRDAMLRRVGLFTEDPDERDTRHHVASVCAAALAAGVTAWAVTTPVVMFHVGMLSPLGAPLSALAVPVFAAILGVGYLTMFLGAIAPSVAVALAPALGLLAGMFLRATRWSESIPFASITTPPVPAWWVALATVCAWRVVRSGARDRGALAASLVLSVFVAVEAARAPEPGRAVALRIDTLSVGDGSCHLVRDATGGTMLWDCGSTWVGVGERDIPEALRALGVWRIDTLVISHANLDHYSGVLDTARRVRPREALVGASIVADARRDPFGPVAHLLARLREMGVPVRTVAAGDEIRIGALRAEILWPPSGFAAERPNDDSIVLRLRVPTHEGASPGERVAMLFGDLEPVGMRGLLEREPGLRADIVEAPHHGSFRPGAVAFLREIAPRVVVQSTGPSRLNDDRWDDAKRGREWWITARDGAITTSVLDDGSIVSGATRPRR